MLRNTERLNQGTDRLKDVMVVTSEMEQRGADILSDLSKQRETLQHTRGSLSYAGEQLEASRRLLRGMARRAMANKLMLRLVTCGIAALILVVVYYQYVGPPAPTAAPASKQADPDWVRTKAP